MPALATTEHQHQVVNIIGIAHVYAAACTELFNQASLYYLVLLASLTRPWQILFLGCCLSIKDYRGYAQGVTSSDYFIFLGYLPWIIVL